MKPLMRTLAALSLSIAAHAALAQGQQQQTPPPPPAQEQQTTQTQQATPAPQADASAGKAVVIVYRPGKFTGKALEPSVFCDKVEVARMDNDRYFVLLLEPGE